MPASLKELSPTSFSVPPSMEMRQAGKSFHFASSLLGSETGEKVRRLYRILRYLDDLVDETKNPEHALRIIDRMTEDLLLARSHDPILRELGSLLEESGLGPELVFVFLDGMRHDLGPVCLKSLRNLHRYCFRVAGTVGLLLRPLLGSQHPEADRFAVDLGMAMQLTNIARDLQEDARRGRFYFPANDFPQLGKKDFENPTSAKAEEVRKLVRMLLAEAGRFYKSAEHGLAWLPFRSRCSVLIASRIYAGIGTELEAIDFAAWSGRVHVGSFRKVSLSAGALTGSFIKRSFWTQGAKHDPRLHRHIEDLFEDCRGER